MPRLLNPRFARHRLYLPLNRLLKALMPGKHGRVAAELIMARPGSRASVRKRGHRLRTRTSTPAPPPVTTAVDAAAVDRGKQQGPGKGKPAKGYRLKPTQLKVEQEKQQLAREQWEQVYAEATTGWAARIAAGKRSVVVTKQLQTLRLGSRCRPTASPLRARC